VIGLYLHVPYCSARCSYCDFYLVTGRGRDLGRFTSALLAEIETTPPALRKLPADSVHFGGGTPSLLPPALLAGILGALAGSFSLAPDAEVALEANPEDLDEARCRDLRALGVNRVTVGVQSLDDRQLSLMRRVHTSGQALEAVRAARAAAIRSVGVDLILGLPGQERGEALAGIERLAALGVDHLSLYLLEVHDRTRLGREVALQRAQPMPDDAAAALYEAAADRLLALGFEHYEISNFARPGHRSRHNLKYWTDQEYVGFGPAAHSYVFGRRWSNAADLGAYLARGGVGCDRIEDPQPPTIRGAEALFAGLRMAEGVDLLALRGRYGVTLPGPDDSPIAELCAAGLLVRSGGRLWLTRRGRLLSNEVFERLLPGSPPAPAPVS
jgi:oxygen-independent coproporphyrinogen-3 oxidase